MAKMKPKFSSNKVYGDCAGPLGFPMRSEIAQEVETLLKTIPRDVRTLFHASIGGQEVEGYCRAYKVAESMDFIEGERADISWITTDSVDRDFEVMTPGGGDWKTWKKNPVVTFAHMYDALPVGRGMWVVREQKGKIDGWKAKTQYIGKPPTWNGDWFADAVWHMVHEKFLPGKSIGFIPLEVKEPEEKDLRGRPELASVGYIITRWLALEYAVAPVQSNPDALVTATAKAKSVGITIPEFMLETMGVIIPDQIPAFDDIKTIPEDDVKPPEFKVPTSFVKLSDVETAIRAECKRLVEPATLQDMVKTAIRLMKGRVS